MNQKNITDIVIGDQLVNITIGRGGISSANAMVLYVYTDNITQLPMKKSKSVLVAITSLPPKKNGAPYCVYAQSKSACLVLDATGAIDYAKSFSHIKIR
jgi:hypothetical protein